MQPQPAYFSPHVDAAGARFRGCMTCAHWQGERYGGHVLCEHRGGVLVIGRPELGCAFWEREPGADDE